VSKTSKFVPLAGAIMTFTVGGSAAFGIYKRISKK